LLGSIGISIHLTSAFVATLPSRAPLRSVTGIALNQSHDWLDHTDSVFILTDGMGNRTLFSTSIAGPWNNQPVRVTYADDGRFEPRVVRIEILKAFLWARATNVNVGWVGTGKAWRRIPLWVDGLGFLLMMLGVLAPANRKMASIEQEKAEKT